MGRRLARDLRGTITSPSETRTQGGGPIRALDELISDERPCLLAVASPGEAAAVLAGVREGEPPALSPWSVLEATPRLRLLLTGVGKSNAAGATSRALSERGYSAVLCLGLAGALPASGGAPPSVRLGSIVLADPCVLADEGIATPHGFESLSAMGFPAHESLGERFPADPRLHDAVADLADHASACATVSACSGTDDRADRIVRDTGASIEDMESAAVALVCARLGVPFVACRVVSNTTGDRRRQTWDLDLAFSVLTRLASRL